MLSCILHVLWSVLSATLFSTSCSVLGSRFVSFSSLRTGIQTPHRPTPPYADHQFWVFVLTIMSVLPPNMDIHSVSRTVYSFDSWLRSHSFWPKETKQWGSVWPLSSRLGHAGTVGTWQRSSAHLEIVVNVFGIKIDLPYFRDLSSYQFPILEDLIYLWINLSGATPNYSKDVALTVSDSWAGIYTRKGGVSVAGIREIWKMTSASCVQES